MGKGKYTYRIVVVLFSLLCIWEAQISFASKDFGNDRREAISDFKNGNVTLALRKLERLGASGDINSFLVLGALHLTVDSIKSIRRSERYFLKALDIQCHPNAIEGLRRIYTTRGSSRFDPLKFKSLEKNCGIPPRAPKLTEEDGGGSDNSDGSIAGQPKKPNSQSTVRLVPKMQEPRISDEVRLAWAEKTMPKGNPVSGGSAVAINGDGYFLTNHHVIEGCDAVSVTYNGMSAGSHVLAWSENLDIALLQTNLPSPYFATFDVTAPRVGEELFALGYPVEFLFGSDPSFSLGHITNASEMETEIKPAGFLLVSIPIANGNSGGPIFTKELGLRGIVSFGYDSSDLAGLAKEEKGLRLFLETATFNFMISSRSADKWVKTLGIKTKQTRKNQGPMTLQELAESGMKTLGKVLCY